MEDINLIPGELRNKRESEERAKSLLIISVVLLTVSFVFSGGVYIYKMLLSKNIAEILVSKHRNGPLGTVELFFHETRASFSSFSKRDYS